MTTPFAKVLSKLTGVIGEGAKRLRRVLYDVRDIHAFIDEMRARSTSVSLSPADLTPIEAPTITVVHLSYPVPSVEIGPR